MKERKAIILLVEDDSNDEELTRMALLENNIDNEILVVRDGEEALNFLMKGGRPPKLVILDINLPKINGIEVLKRLRENKSTSRIPVVVFTSSKEEQDLLAAYTLKVNAFVRKPIAFDDFSLAIGQLARFWLFRNEVPSSE